MRNLSALLFSLLPCILFASAAAAPLPSQPVMTHERVYYEIFVRSFQDSDGDGIGDLRGITSRLDYLKELGIGGIWLTPIFKSPSYHGYDTTDYRSIQPSLGTLADLDALIAAAHARDIRVLLDLAINHTSSRHPWFSTRHDWYVWRDEAPAWPGPQHWFQEGEQFFYAFFGQSMPDLNLKNPEVVSEIKSAARYWLSRGIDGFRLDAARYYIEGPEGEPDTAETHALIRELASDLKASFPEMTLIGEIWSELDTIIPYVASGEELDLAFDFPFSGGLLSSLTGGAASGLSGALRQSAASVSARFSPFLTNHDMVRIASQLSRHAWTKDPMVLQRTLKLAAATLLSQPGPPFIYYGEEIGMIDGHTGTRGDLDKRNPMQWDESLHHGFTSVSGTPWIPFASDDPTLTVQGQQYQAGSLLESYRALLALRAAHPALQSDGLIQVLPDPSSQVSAYIRSRSSEEGAERVLVVLNFGNTPVDQLRMDVPGAVPELLWGEAQVKRRKTGTPNLVISGLAAGSGLWIRL